MKKNWTLILALLVSLSFTSCLNPQGNLDVGVRQNVQDGVAIKSNNQEIGQLGASIEDKAEAILSIVEEEKPRELLVEVKDDAQLLQTKSHENEELLDGIVERNIALTEDVSKVQNLPSGFFSKLKDLFSSVKTIIYLGLVLGLLTVGGIYGAPTLSRILIGFMTKSGLGIGRRREEIGKLLHEAKEAPTPESMAALATVYRASSRSAEAAYRRAKLAHKHKQIGDDRAPP